ncbi:MAG TPA: CotH kinase family protein [Ignavibacteriaceae bacterium]|mgnify:CR=1 FL=1|nr:CotH kinase family protein [Ignavibacteriaceae bacterium]
MKSIRALLLFLILLITSVSSFSQVVINEIMYNPPDVIGNDDFFEWIELYNNSTSPIDVSGWRLLDDDNSHSPFIMPVGTIISANGFLVIGKNVDSVSAFYNLTNVVGGISWNFGNSTDQVRLFNQFGVIQDSVLYLDNAPWPSAADGNGKSLELINPNLENSSYFSWRASVPNHGTPGAMNSVYQEVYFLPPPQNLKVTERTTSSIKISWSKMVGINAYHVERRDWPDTNIIHTSLNTADTTLLFSNLQTGGEVYLFRVKAIQDTIPGLFSNYVYGVTKGVSAHLPQYRVMVSQMNIDSMNSNVAADIIVPTTLIIGDSISVDGNIRYRGETARYWPKKSFRVTLPSSYLVNGHYKVNFNAEYVDESLIRSKLSYDLFNSINLPSSKCQMVHLSLNEGFYGVMANTEAVDEPLLQRHGYHLNGSLYKGNCELKLGQAYLNEKNMGDPNDYSDLISLINFIHKNMQNSAWRDSAINLIDIEKFFDWYSINMLVSNMDFPAKNYYLYNPLPQKRWLWLPWDYDLSFGRHWWYDNFFYYNLKTDDAIDGGTINNPKVDDKYNMLLTRLLMVPEFVQIYKQKLLNNLNTVFAQDLMYNNIDTNFQSIYEDALLDTRKSVSNTVFMNQDLRLKSFVLLRREFVGNVLQKVLNTNLHEAKVVKSSIDTLIAVDGLNHPVVRFVNHSCVDSAVVDLMPTPYYNYDPNVLAHFTIRRYGNNNCSNLRFGLTYLRSDYYFSKFTTTSNLRVYQNINGNWMQLSSYNFDAPNKTFWVNSAINDSVYSFAIAKSSPITDIEDLTNEPIKFDFVLEQNFPNPFNPSTTIRFSIPSDVNQSSANVSLKIYDVLGNEVLQLINASMPPGFHEVEFNGNNLSTGIYFYQLKYGAYSETKKLLLIK